MITETLKYIRQNAVAFIALFVALSGTAFAAASLPKNSVGTKQIKKRAVTGSKVRKNTLTGAQIRESKLKRVPDASRLRGLPPSAFLAADGTAVNAANAANADKLDGVDSAVFGSALTVAGSVFELRDTTGTTKKSYVSTGSISATGGTDDFHYAVHLPQGARITSLDHRYVDNDGTSNSTLSLEAFDSIGANGVLYRDLVAASSTGSAAGRRNASAAPAATEIIDNTRWSYVLVWSIFPSTSNIQLVGARVNYELPTG